VPDLSGGVPNLFGFAQQAAAEGMSQNRFIAAWREQGYRISNDIARSVYRDAVASVANRAEATQVPRDQIPPGPLMQDLLWGRGGRYATRVQVAMWSRSAQQIDTLWYTYVTDEPHTPGAAEAGALELFDQNEYSDEGDLRPVGAQASEFFRTVPQK
jgi:hypothetical protein